MTINDKYESFLSVIESNKGIIYKVAKSFCKDMEDRKDLVQEIILKLWKSFETYDEQFKHSTWIYRISLNVAISFYRKEKSRNKINAPFSESIFNVADFQDNKETEQNAVFLTRFISELKELDKALMLLYLEEKSHKEMAEIIGITETNVATKIGRIKTVLKQKFSQI
ncbi:MAG: DNA-directed polymerase specialized sigma subunit, sigma24 [Bacteroidetes bacterium]|nr:DNA-directed polymerase specialized sigma subunit, sigma24 [Bacteroidota bacterium]